MGHFRDESFQPITCGPRDRTQKNTKVTLVNSATHSKNRGEERGQTERGLVALYDIGPEYVAGLVLQTVDTFKNRLDKYWSKQEVLYNYKAKFTGSGHRSYVT